MTAPTADLETARRAAAARAPAAAARRAAAAERAAAVADQVAALAAEQPPQIAAEILDTDAKLAELAGV